MELAINTRPLLCSRNVSDSRNAGSMFRKCILAYSLLLLTSYAANSQEMNMDMQTHQLFFNIFREKPDTSILGFLKLYTPSLYEKKNLTQGPNWIIYSSIDTLRAYREIHSFVFTSHPYFTEKFTQGKLEIYCKRYEDTKLLQNITNVQLWFEFETQPEAEIAFTRLVDRFILLATEQKFSTVIGAQKAAFTNSKETRGFNRVQFRLTADNVSLYRYKILFETGNDL